MRYAERLPEQCPPASAEDTALEPVYRLLERAEVTAQNFLSYAALGKPSPTGADACRWASCSLVKDAKKQIERWPRLRDTCPFAAELSIPAGSGRSSSKSGNNHIDFWAYYGFDLTSAVSKVFQIAEGSNA